MKYRKDFVTNSSSVAYVCEITGRADGGRDEDIDKFEMGFVDCHNGHTFGTEFIIPTKESVLAGLKSRIEAMERVGCKEHLEEVQEYVTELENGYTSAEAIIEANPFGCNGVPPEMCPICQIEKVRDKDLIKYLLMKVEMSREEVESDMRENYEDYDAMRKDLD